MADGDTQVGMSEAGKEIKRFSEETISPFMGEMQVLVYKISMGKSLDAGDIKRLAILKSVISTYNNLVDSKENVEKRVRAPVEEKESEIDELTKEFGLDSLDQSFRQKKEIHTIDPQKQDKIEEEIGIDHQKLMEEKDAQDEFDQAVFEEIAKKGWYNPVCEPVNISFLSGDLMNTKQDEFPDDPELPDNSPEDTGDLPNKGVVIPDYDSLPFKDGSKERVQPSAPFLNEVRSTALNRTPPDDSGEDVVMEPIVPPYEEKDSLGKGNKSLVETKIQYPIEA